MATKNYTLDLNLPVQPTIPDGPEYEEFLTVYKALNALQDGIAEVGSLVGVDPDALELLDVYSLYLDGSRNMFVFEAATDIAVGEPVMLDFSAGYAKVRQPAIVPPTGFNYAQVNYVIGFPMFACLAGQKVLIGSKGAVVPAPGAVVGQQYQLNSSGLKQSGYDVWFAYDFGTRLYFFYALGGCVVPDTLLLSLEYATW